MENSFHLEHTQLGQLKEGGLPLLGGQREILFVSNGEFLLASSGVRGARSVVALRVSQGLSVELPLVRYGAFGVVESLSLDNKLSLSKLNRLQLFDDRISSLSRGNQNLSSVVQFSLVERFVDFSVVLVTLKRADLSLDVSSEASLFKLRPLVTEVTHCSLRKQDLILGELAVLSQRVQADNLLDLGGQERSVSNFFPLFFFGHKFISIGLVLLLEFLLLLGPVLLLFLLLFSALLDAEVAGNSGVESFLRKARVVLKADSKVGTETGHLEELDVGVSDNFFDNLDLRQDFLYFFFSLSKRVFRVFFNGLFSFNRLGVLEYVECDTFTRVEHSTDEHLVFFGGLREPNNFLTHIIDVGRIVVTLLNLTLRSHVLSNVDSCGGSEFLQVVGQVLKLVVQVFTLLDLLSELSNSLVFLVLLGLLDLLFLEFDFLGFGVAVLELMHLFLLVINSLRSALHL